MSALGGTDLFDLYGIFIMKSIIFYHIRIKIYSCLGICIFINLYMALSINVKSLRVIREVIFSQMHRSTMNWKCNHYWTTRPIFYPFYKDKLRLSYLHLAAGKFNNCSFLSWIKAMSKKRLYWYKIWTYYYLPLSLLSLFYQDIESILIKIWKYYNI